MKRHSLTYLEEAPKQGRWRRIKVKCDCGTVKVINYNNFGKTKSCGCKLRQHIERFKHSVDSTF